MERGRILTKNELTYGGRQQTALANIEQNSALIAQAAQEMRMANDPTRERVPLRDLERVREVATDYLAECAQTGTMPTVRGCAARLGVTRYALYDYAKHHVGSEFAAWLEDFSDACGEVMMAAAMQGSVSPVPAIFTAKARHGWREAPLQVEFGRLDPQAEIDEDELRQRIMADVIVPEMEG